MASLDRFQVVLLPRREVMVSDLKLSEAAAYLRGYHDVMPPGRQEAVIARVRQAAQAASARSLRRPGRAVESDRPAARLHSA